jgi:hypothetical protein
VSEPSLRPLHVRVAEVLGCKPVAPGDLGPFEIQYETDVWRCGCNPHFDPDIEVHEDLYNHTPHALERYDSYWSATGPLIERFGISLAPDQALTGTWGAWVGDFAPLTARHTNPLVAVCLLLLVMSADRRKGLTPAPDLR